MKKLVVNVQKPYDILIERNIIRSCGSYINKITKAKKVVVITDTNVEQLYLDIVVKSLSEYFEVFSYSFEAGEKSKTVCEVTKMIEFMAENSLSRNDLAVALGGGVTGDMAGFAASCYLRGIDFVQIPTTLLSQIDSSVGGKTGVDLPQGKNLCGAFHQPSLVLIDPDVLETLSKHFFNDGIGEAIKYGCIKSEKLFSRLENENAKEFIEDLIFECVDIKRQVVENDEKEKGERALLNFGHTVGHAIEKLNNFEGLSHGEAVAIGMVYVTRAAEKSGMTERGTTEKLVKLLQKYSLPVKTDFDLEQLVPAMLNDKKQTGSGIKFITLEKIGTGVISPVQNENIKKFLSVLYALRQYRGRCVRRGNLPARRGAEAA